MALGWWLFLDSSESPPSSSWVVCRTAEQAIRYCQHHGLPAKISIGTKSKTSADPFFAFVIWFCEVLYDDVKRIPKKFEYRFHGNVEDGFKSERALWSTMFYLTGKDYRKKPTKGS